MDNTEDCGDDKLSWTSKEEEYLINLMVSEVRKGSLSSSTFHKSTWTQIDNQMFEKFKKRYTVTKLKQKFNRLRSKWKLFKELIDCTGFGWDPQRNTIDADEEKWAKKIGENREYKQFRKRGCDHYDLLGEIFSETVATGKLARSSTQGPLNSNEEQEVEEVFLHGTASSMQFPNDPIYTELDDNISEMESPSNNRKSKKRSKSRSNSHVGSHSKSQCADSSIVDEAWTAFKDAQLSKKKLYDNIAGPSKEEECVDILEMMEDISSDQYLKAIEKLSDHSLRLMFIRMSDTRRRQWLQSLAP